MIEKIRSIIVTTRVNENDWSATYINFADGTEEDIRPYVCTVNGHIPSFPISVEVLPENGKTLVEFI